MSRRIEVAFDTMGGPSVGVGHVVRTLALADRVRAFGAHVTVLEPVIAPLTGKPARLARAKRPDVIAVDRPDTTEALLRDRHSRWPGARVVALDYYGEDVDGLATVVSLNDGRRRKLRRQPRHRLHGLEYATLRPSFAAARRVRRSIPARVKQIVIGFGGTDPHGWTDTAIATVQAVVSDDVTLHAIRSMPDPAPLLAQCDLAIIGGGTMMMEAACVGLPAIVVPRTPEEQVFAKQFLRAGAIRLLPVRGAFPVAALQRSVRALIDDRATRRRMHRAGRALIDGRGLDRVARLIVRAAQNP